MPDRRQRLPELRPVDDARPLLARVPWTAAAEVAAGATSVALVGAAFVGAFDGVRDGRGGADAVLAIQLGVALLLLVPLMLRHPLALARASHRTRLEAERARHDHLTGLPNRLAADAELDALLARGAALTERARRGGGTKGVVPYWPGAAYLLIDLDHFKPVNDGAGHAAGDRLLVEVASLLCEACGPHDLPARVGGDEFAIVMNRRDEAEARALACAVRNALSSHVFAVDGRRYPVSGSIGLARIAPSDTDADAIRAAADRCAYRAKEAGRNTVFEVSGPGAEPVPVDTGERRGAARDTAVRASGATPGVLARRALGLGVPDRLEFALDSASHPSVPGAARRHVATLAAVAARCEADVPVAVVMPPLLGGQDLEALEEAVRLLAARRGRGIATTVLLEISRRRGESTDVSAAAGVVRAAGLCAGVVCRTHSLTGLAELSPLAIDEVQLYLAHSPPNTLEAYATIARACGGWSLGVGDVASMDAVDGWRRLGVRRITGPAVGPSGVPDEVRATLNRLPMSVPACGTAGRAA